MLCRDGDKQLPMFRGNIVLQPQGQAVSER